MDNQPTSPLPGVNTASRQPDTMTFPGAMVHVIRGQRITRIAWNNPNSYGLLKDGFLMICIDGIFHTWTLTDVDLNAEDWKVISQAN